MCWCAISVQILMAHHIHASAIVAIDTNLDTSTPDTYRAPPAPLPYDVSLPVTENLDLEKSDIKSKTDDQQDSLKVDEYELWKKVPLKIRSRRRMFALSALKVAFLLIICWYCLYLVGCGTG
uniref:Uncharacterized protein n=1 Tax=Aegilops tauschii TaxID=37682 RepID=M8B8X1_AEGTA